MHLIKPPFFGGGFFILVRITKIQRQILSSPEWIGKSPIIVSLKKAVPISTSGKV